jgi:hypothetical protein
MAFPAFLPPAARRPAACRDARRPLAALAIAVLMGGAVLLPAPASAAGPLVRFDGGIGSQPLRAGGLANDVNGVAPGGRPWVIERLTAEVATDGRIRVDGRGLLVAGGPAIATAAGQSVRARLFCDSQPAGDSELVALQPNGDFRIDGVLVPTPPSVCNTPVLLIVNAANAWFAAGIPKD